MQIATSRLTPLDGVEREAKFSLLPHVVAELVVRVGAGF